MGYQRRPSTSYNQTCHLLQCRLPVRDRDKCHWLRHSRKVRPVRTYDQIRPQTLRYSRQVRFIGVPAHRYPRDQPKKPIEKHLVLTHLCRGRRLEDQSGSGQPARRIRNAALLRLSLHVRSSYGHTETIHLILPSHIPTVAAQDRNQYP